ncbi:flagellar hook-basal body protein [Variovorax terrae]|uniref:Flagellar hook-basal body protein n=1 Tax=Variovorax terrae TaxID=2923278 RepID=A0A9X1VVG7_9BURK|nr:flagellar hook-basal body protein [Variovorax terrae]MCJ0764551.1 flagellar hook-basal body protein [Variovorax terrae]
MNEILAISLNSMHQDMARLERVGVNLANALTPGYKRDVVVTLPQASPLGGTFVQSMDNERMSGSRSTSQNVGALATVLVDTRAGTLKSTGQSLDLALTGPGYFEISTADGLAYTRQGAFRLDGRGRLVTARGDLVMGKGGEIFLNRPDPFIDGSGQVFESKTASGSVEAIPVAQIKVVNFESPSSLVRLGDGLWGSGSSAVQVNDVGGQVRQGSLENSNVSSMQEMMSLMQTMRHFESMQKVALGYDEMLGTAIRKLGDLS